MEKKLPKDKKDHGRTRYADCSGSYKCMRERCSFEGKIWRIKHNPIRKKRGRQTNL